MENILYSRIRTDIQYLMSQAHLSTKSKTSKNKVNDTAQYTAGWPASSGRIGAVPLAASGVSRVVRSLPLGYVPATSGPLLPRQGAVGSLPYDCWRPSDLNSSLRLALASGGPVSASGGVGAHSTLTPATSGPLHGFSGAGIASLSLGPAQLHQNSSNFTDSLISRRGHQRLL